MTPDALPTAPAGPSQSRARATAPRSLLDRLTWRLDDIAEATGLSRRTLERERSAGRFPRPDLVVGKMPLWRPETIRAWVEGGGRP